MFAAEAQTMPSERVTLPTRLTKCRNRLLLSESVKAIRSKARRAWSVLRALACCPANPPRCLRKRPSPCWKTTHQRRKLIGGTVECLTLPTSDTLRWLLTDDSWIVIRPSGTEPKLKLYIGARAKTREAVEEVLALLMADVDGRLTKLLSKPVQKNAELNR